MAGGIKIAGGTTGNNPEVDAPNGNLLVTLPLQKTGNIGLAGLAAINHDGVAGSSRVVRLADVSLNRRVRVGLDNLLFQDGFTYAAQNTAVWSNVLTTMTLTYAGGYATLNAGSSVASAAVARMTTYAFFQRIPGGGLYFELSAIVVQLPQTSNVIEIGWFQASGTTAPTDGVFFRYTGGGAFVGVISYGGAETTTGSLTVPTKGVDHSYQIRIHQEAVEFWVDGNLVGSITTPAGQDGPTSSDSQPITVRTYNSAGTSLAQQVKVGGVRLYTQDLALNRSWETQAAGMGWMGSQGQNGGTMGSTALYTNSLAAGAGAAATNTTAALGSGLGGQFSLLPTLTAGTDGVISSYQVPAGSATIPGRALIIRGVKIQGVVTTVLAGGPVIAAWSLAYGHTAVSLATAEAASAKAARRVPLGIQVFTANAAVATRDDREVSMQFLAPIRVEPGAFVQTVLKNLGTVTTTGVITFLISFDAYWE